jgi:hypothetical protein
MSKFYDSMLAHVAESPCSLSELFSWSGRPSIIGVKAGMNQFVKSKMLTYVDGTYAITEKGLGYLAEQNGD